MNDAHQTVAPPWPIRAAAIASLIAATLTGCASIASTATSRMSQHLAAAVLDQNDPETVRQGAPAYLILADSLIADDPENSALAQGGARLYAAYAAAFVSDPARAQRLTRRAVDYADRALCAELPPRIP